tara:strand:- start:3937 stop:4446 length:510 start_codon:yes stop_codon:yes gene_type:complete
MATLTNIISDSITIDGTNYGSSTTQVINSQAEVYQRRFVIPPYDGANDFISLFSATRLPLSAGDVNFERFAYARFTNLDSQYPLWLKITDVAGVCENPASAGYCFITIIPPGGSYIMTSNRIMATSGNLTAENFFDTPPNVANTVYALADRNSRGVEMDMLISTSEEIR